MPPEHPVRCVTGYPLTTLYAAAIVAAAVLLLLFGGH
jgi:hypothetical protein